MLALDKGIFGYMVPINGVSSDKEVSMWEPEEEEEEDDDEKRSPSSGVSSDDSDPE